MSKRELLALKLFVATLLILLIFHLLSRNTFILAPFVGVIEVVFLPFVITAVLFYLFRPLVRWLADHKIHRGIAVLLIYLAFGAVLSGIVLMAGPVIQEQFVSFSEQVPEMVDSITNGFEFIRGQEKDSFPGNLLNALPSLDENLLSQLNENAGYLTDSIFNAISGIGSAIISLFLVPFILYYALKDGKQIPPRLLELAPSGYRKHLPKLLSELDQTIASYILGQALVSLCVGILLFIGYTIIGLDYSIVLALIGLLVNVVPFLGPIIATLPALLVALFQDPIMALYVILVSVVAQQIEGNLISPQVMGRSLDIHPLTVILLLFAAGSLLGILGIIFIVPAYALSKVFIEHGIKLYRLHQ